MAIALNDLAGSERLASDFVAAERDCREARAGGCAPSITAMARPPTREIWLIWLWAGKTGWARL